MNLLWHYIEDFETGEVKIYCDVSSAYMAYDARQHFKPRPVIEYIGDKE